MTDTANLALPCVEGSQAQKHVTHNDALRILDTLVQLAVLDRDLTAPPGSPAEGQRWIVKTGATVAWAGHVNAIAAWQDGVWQFSAPRLGWVAFVADEAALVVWNGSAWTDYFSTVAIQNLSMLGLGTTADTTNRVSAKLNNTLWTAKTVAEGGDGNLRYKLSKESAAKTVSLLMQDNFSGRAEVGLTGDDDFHFKVSPDGTTWYEGIKIAAASGSVTFPNTTIAGGRELLSANRTYYVRTDGSDGNNGLANTSGGAFATIQKAIGVTGGIDLSIYNVTIQVRAGTYLGAVSVAGPFVGSGSVQLIGDMTTPSNVVISAVAASCISVANHATLNVGGFKLTTATSGSGLDASNYGVIAVTGKMEFAAMASGYHHIAATAGGLVKDTAADYIISGGAFAHMLAASRGQVQISGRTVTLTGTPAFSNFVFAGTLGYVSGTSNTYSGSATGVRYSGSANAVIDSSGGGANYFPGSSAGSVVTGAQYI